MNDTPFTIEERPTRPTALQTPFQTPAIDRSATVPQGADGDDSGGVEANFGFGDILKTAAKFLL
ncbi:hypothetical protein [Streptomyces cupreus]|uniref:Uncharacterized protein n=1 Tax=Streptomyces cupreus TaxID=2759956 RepID=A0A7X1IXD0_9ACTN|nr:hypothetical protein [Streptomyces cupreus]MBC2900331.1 hypothetical protein [Streptomyces cupreus]